VFGWVLGAAGSVIGIVVAILFVPRSFAIPSLMADLGNTQPTPDLMVIGSIVAIGVTAVIVGLAPTGLRLLRQALAASLSEGRS
jgi:predicted membrane protein